MRDNLACFLLHKHDRDLAIALCPNDVLQPLEIYTKHTFVKKQNCRQCLVLRRRRHVGPYGKVGQKFLDLGRPHITRVTLVIGNDESANPLDIGLFRGKTVVAKPHGVPHLVQQSGLALHT